jgi:protein-disulfide isomerase
MMQTDRRSFLIGCAGVIAGLLLACASPVWAAADDQDMAAKLLAAVPPHGERSLGAADAPVVIIEYASATCPHCAEFHADALPEIKKTYIDTGKARLIFREFPLDQRAMAVFMLTRCVPEDKYFATLDMVFRQQKSWTGKSPKAPLMKIMQMAGMSEAEFDACLKREDLAKAIFETRETANKQFGVKGTPTFFVNGQFVDGHKDASAVSAAIEAALKRQ